MSQDICEAIRKALTSALRDVPLTGVRINSLCKEAGIGRATFYRYYGSMDDLVDSIYVDLMGRIESSVVDHEGRGWRGYSAYMHNMFRTMYGDRELLLLLHRNGMTRRMIPVLESSFGFNSIDNPEERYSLAYHVGGIVSFMSEWLDRDMVDDPDTIADIAIRVRSSTGRPVLMNP